MHPLPARSTNVAASTARRGARPWRVAGVVVLIAIATLMVVLAAIPPLVTRPMIAGRVTFGQTFDGAASGLAPERLSLTTDDDLALAAFAVHVDAPKAVIVFLSGTHAPSVTAFFGHAAWLAGHGYASLLVEMRARGESGGERIGLGYAEVADAQAAVSHLTGEARYADVPIVAFGLSLGGATAISAAGVTPQIAGVVSLSAFSSWSGVFVDNMGLPEPLATLQRSFVSLYTGLTFGFDRRHLTAERQIARLGERPALLVHSLEDSQVPFASFERIVARAPDHVETWVRDGDAHLVVAEGSFLRPWEDAAYAERVLHFLERHFGD